MSLIDTSAWIEFMRDTNSRTCNEVGNILKLDPEICDIIRMEVLAGARDEQHLTQLERLLARATTVRTESVDYDNAAKIYRACRRLGITVHTQVDCLIAAIAIRADLRVLHNDADFEAIARVTKLKTYAS